jgi:hypothetical protein
MRQKGTCKHDVFNEFDCNQCEDEAEQRKADELIAEHLKGKISLVHEQKKEQKSVAWRLTQNRGNGKEEFTYVTNISDAYLDNCIAIEKLYLNPVVAAPYMTDADIVSIAYDCNALPEVITDKTLLIFARAIEAVIRGQYEVQRQIK